MGKITDILIGIDESNKKELRDLPSKSRFEEIVGYLKLIEKVSKDISPEVLNSGDGQNLINPLIDIMMKIEYLQSDFMRLKNK